MTDRPATTMVVEDRPYRELDDGLIGVYGYSYDEQAITQIRTVSRHGWVAGASLMADNHVGYSMPIGGVAAYREMVSPSGVGYDIGCGVMAVRTALSIDEVRGDLGRLADEIARGLSFGVGRKNATRVEHRLFDSETWAAVPELTEQVAGRKGSWSLRERAEAQLGTVGSGNHYVDLLVEPADGAVWIAAHFGSRGFGHGVATGFLNVAGPRVPRWADQRRVDARRAVAAAAIGCGSGRARLRRPGLGGGAGPPVSAGDGAGRRVRICRAGVRDLGGAGHAGSSGGGRDGAQPPQLRVG